jgi:hypothetical protein
MKAMAGQTGNMLNQTVAHKENSPSTNYGER